MHSLVCPRCGRRPLDEFVFGGERREVPDWITDPDERDFDEVWGKVDVVLTPTTPSPAFAFGEKSGDPIAMYLEDIFTVTVNMAGLPGISVPGGLSAEGLPLGLQLIGKPFDEATLFAAAQAIEDRAGRFPVPQRWWM